MEFKVAVIVGEDVKEMVRLENAMHMYGFTITCFKFTNLNEAIDFVFMQPDPVDYLLVEADKLLLEEKWLLKALTSMGESPHMVTAVYSKNKAINVTRIKKQLGLHMAVRLPADPYEYICQMGFILVHHEMHD
jgi:hypothetical protein